MYGTCEPVELFERQYYERLTEKIIPLVDKYSEIRHYEIYSSANQDTSVNFEGGIIKDASQKSSGGIGLRVIDSQGREGTTFTSDFSDTAIEIVVTQAKKIMEAATPNPYFKDLAHPPDTYKPIEKTFDSKIENICPDNIDDIMTPFFDLKSRDLKPRSLSGGFSTNLGTIYIWNSNGISQWEKYTTAGCNVELSLKNTGTPSSGFAWKAVCQLDELQIPEVADECYNMAIRGLKKQTVPSGRYPLILSPIAVANFIINPLAQGINAERVQNQMSFLGDHLNEKIASSQLNLKDDPFIPGKLGTESFDAEGVPTEALDLVSNGQLKNFYHNTLTASKAKRTSNGHASRGSYSSGVGVGNHNIIMENGSRSWKDIVGDIDEGIYFEYSGDTPNYVTGDFSGLIMTGYLIENGEIGPALIETLLNINLLDVYHRIEAISSERKWIDEIHAPYVKISEASISGRK